jgi:co-chaperonin GroES (HSP10)
MTCPFTPLFARVVVAREKLKTSTSIIILEDSAKKHSLAQGRVVAVGPTADESIQVGDLVRWGNFAGDWISFGDDEYYILQDEDILVKIKE